MHESEEYQLDIDNSIMFRVTSMSIIKFNYDFLELKNITYFQPSLDSFSDFRIMNEFDISFEINNWLSYELNYIIRFDNQKPIFLEEKIDNYITSGFNFKIENKKMKTKKQYFFLFYFISFTLKSLFCFSDNANELANHANLYYWYATESQHKLSLYDSAKVYATKSNSLLNSVDSLKPEFKKLLLKNNSIINHYELTSAINSDNLNGRYPFFFNFNGRKQASCFN